MTDFPPISNYKGVMLCDRPSADTMPKRPAPFNSAVVPAEQLGLNPPKKLNVHSTDHKEKNTDSILYKHKQYLHLLQKDIRDQKAQEAAGADRAKEKRKQFVERSAQLREAVRAGLLGPPEATSEPAPPANEDTAAPEEHEEQEAASAGAAAAAVPPLKLGKKDLSKPAWAFTEQGAEDRDELAEEVDVDDLLDFVEGLDFESYVDDLEVQQALEVMRSRITTLDTARTGEGADGETANKPKVVPLRPGDSEEVYRGDAAALQGADATDANVTDAKDILHSSRALRTVHSTKSIAARLEKLSEEQEMEEAMSALATQAGADGDGTEGGRKKEVDPSNLPYLYRNPAI